MKKQATIYDFARMCKGNNGECKYCPLGSSNNKKGITCDQITRKYPDKANEIILKWCEEHPVKTRQDKFLEIYPNANVSGGVVRVCPSDIESSRHCQFPKCKCLDCLRNYWLAEVDE